MIRNPIIPGLNCEPCVCRKGNDFYIVCTSSQWAPKITVYHSKDLKNWECLAVTAGDNIFLQNSEELVSPHISYSEEENLFYITYTVKNENGCDKENNSYYITANDVLGKWSQPVFLFSNGFDTSIFHLNEHTKLITAAFADADKDNSTNKICIAEYNTKEKCIIKPMKSIFFGATKRGMLKAPRLYKIGIYYYLICSEGGQGYYNSVTIARSENPFSIYESYYKNPIITSSQKNNDELNNTDEIKPEYLAKNVYLQKCGYGSLIQLVNGDTYIVHSAARPLVPEKASVLGSEIAISQMEWTDDGWLKMAGDTNIAKEFLPNAQLEPFKVEAQKATDNFDGDTIDNIYCRLINSKNDFADILSRKGHLRLTGSSSLQCDNNVSMLARRIESFDIAAETKIDFCPTSQNESAGLVLFYDNHNYIYLKKYFSSTLNQQALTVVSCINSVVSSTPPTSIENTDNITYLQLRIYGKMCFFRYKTNENKNFVDIGCEFSTANFCCEKSKFNKKSGAMVAIVCIDENNKSFSDFDYFTLCANDNIPL